MRLKLCHLAAIVFLFLLGCQVDARKELETRFGVALPSRVVVHLIDSSAGFGDPWICWEISPVDSKYFEDVKKKWSLDKSVSAIPGVISSGSTYCSYKELFQGFGRSDGTTSRFVGIDKHQSKMIFYFYNG